MREFIYKYNYMKFHDLTTLIESERVPNMYKMGYNSPEQLTQYRQHHYNSTNMDGGTKTPSQPNAYPESEENIDNQGDINDFIDSGSLNGYYSLNNNTVYWAEPNGDNESLLAQLASSTGSEDVNKDLELFKLELADDILHVTPTYRALHGFDENAIITNLGTPRSAVKFNRNVELPKTEYKTVSKLYKHHLSDEL